MNKLSVKYSSLSLPVKASIWFVICNILQKSVYFFMIPVYTRIMPPTDYGVFSIFTSWVTVIAAFAGLNLAGNSFNVGMVKYENDRDRYTSCIQGLWWANTTIWLILGFLLRDLWEYYSGLSFNVMLAIFADIYVISCFDLWSAKQKFDYNYKALVVITSLIAVITPIVSIFIVLNSADKSMAAIWCKVGVMGFFSIAVGIINVIKGKSLFDYHYWKNALLFNIPLIAYYLSLTVLSQSDRIMIGVICGNDLAGIYSIAYSLAMVLTLLNAAVNGSFIPWEFKNMKVGTIQPIKKISNYILIMVGVANLLLIAVSPEIIHCFTTSAYHSAIWIVPPIALSSFFMCEYQFFVNIEFYFEKNRFVMTASIAVALLNIVMNFIFIPRFGYMAAAYTTLISYLAFTVAHYIFMKKTCKQEGFEKMVYDIQSFFYISLVMTLLSFIFLLSYNFTFLRYLLILLIASIAIFIIFFKNDNESDFFLKI